MSLKTVFTHQSLFEGFTLPYDKNEHAAVKNWFLNTIDDTVTHDFLNGDAFFNWASRFHACFDRQNQYSLSAMLKHWAGSSGLAYSAWDMHSDKWIYQFIKACDQAEHYDLANGLIVNKWYQRKSPYQEELKHLYEQRLLNYAQVIAHLDVTWQSMSFTLMETIRLTPNAQHILSPHAKAALLLRGVEFEFPITLETTHALGELSKHPTSCWNPIWEPSALDQCIKSNPSFGSPIAYGWWSSMSMLRPSARQHLHTALDWLEPHSPAWWLIIVACYVDPDSLDEKIASTVTYLRTTHPEIWLQHMNILTMASQLGMGPKLGQEMAFIQKYSLGQINTMKNVETYTVLYDHLNV